MPKKFSENHNQAYELHTHHRRNSWDYDENHSPWSPWSRWRLALKLVYAVVVPAVIVYLLRRFDQSLQHQRQLQHPFQHRSESNLPLHDTPCLPTSSSPSFQGCQTQGSVGGNHDKSSLLTKTLTDAFARMGISLPHSHSHSHHLHHLHHNYNPRQYRAEPGMVQQTAFDSFLLFGDSITQYSFDVNGHGFGAQLAHLFQRRLDVINRGFSGYTTEQAIHLLPQFLPRSQQDSTSSSQPKIQFLTIFFGANDACLLPSPQHVDLERYEQNLRTLIDTVHSPTSPTYSPETRIIVICPPTIDEDRWAIRRKGQGLMMDRDKDVSKQYAEACLKVAKEYESKNDQRQSPQHSQVDVIDTWGLMTEQIESGKRTLGDYLRDGLHLASEGNNLIFEQIMKVIRSRFPEWDPDTMPMNAPWWGDLDRKHPETDLLICGNKVKA